MDLINQKEEITVYSSKPYLMLFNNDHLVSIDMFQTFFQTTSPT